MNLQVKLNKHLTIHSSDFGSVACSHKDCKEMLSESNGFTDKLIDTNCVLEI